MAIATKTCQDVLSGALAFSPANPALVVGSSAEVLQRVRAQQRATFTHVATRSREYLVTGVLLTSSIGNGNRTFDLSTISPPVERTLQLVTAFGVTLNQVDPLDLPGELAPRYYPVGLTLVEVANEWGPPGAITATLHYGYAPVDINPFGSMAQQLSLPDQWIDILIGDLAAYLRHKDHRSDPTGTLIGQARALSDGRLAELDLFLDMLAGARAWRTDVPRPVGVYQ